MKARISVNLKFTLYRRKAPRKHQAVKSRRLLSLIWQMLAFLQNAAKAATRRYKYRRKRRKHARQSLNLPASKYKQTPRATPRRAPKTARFCNTRPKAKAAQNLEKRRCEIKQDFF